MVKLPYLIESRVTHICVGNLTIIGPDNGLSPGRRQAIIWTNAGILLIGPWGTNFSEIFIGIQTFSFKKMHLKMSSAKWHPFCLGLNVLWIWISLYRLNIWDNPLLYTIYPWNSFCTLKRSTAMITGLILGLSPANEGRCYFVTTSLIGWVHA